MTSTTQRLTAVEGRLTALDPRGVLLRGYALVLRPEDGTLIPSAAQAVQAERVQVQFFDGAVEATINSDGK